MIKRMSVMAGLGSLITSGSIVHNTNNNDTEKDDTVSFSPSFSGLYLVFDNITPHYFYPNVFLLEVFRVIKNAFKCPEVSNHCSIASDGLDTLTC